MDRSNLTLSIGSLGVLALVIGVSGPVLAMGPPAGPVGEIQATLGIILDRLDDLQDDVDNLSAALGPCEVPPVWGKKFAGANRFVPVLDGAAYCDQETGLVWEGAPDINGGLSDDGTRTWDSAIQHCAELEVDDRKGWSLPMREQLATLVDTQSDLCAGGGPCLPDGHPFSDVLSASYWSTSTRADSPFPHAWGVNFNVGLVGDANKDFPRHAWCARGGQSFDGNTHETFH